MIMARVNDRYAFGSDCLAVTLGCRDPDARTRSRIARGVPHEYNGAQLEYGELPESLGVQVPTMSLTEAEARALLEALAAHFGGTGPARAARDDFLHERGRVDKLTDALIGLAGTLAGE